MATRSAIVRSVTALALFAGGLLVGAAPVAAQENEITSVGPLTRIIVSNTLSCQVAHRDDDQFEFYPSGSDIGNCGTFVALGGSIHGPEQGAATQFPWTPVSQAPVAGTGSAGDPFRILTVVDLPEAALRIQQTDSYVVGSQSYRTDIEVTNLGNALQTGVVYRAGDCYLQGDDRGFVRVDGGAPACIVDPQVGRRIEQWLPITPGSHFFAGHYGEVWSLIFSNENFPDRCECSADVIFDNGAGLSWSLNLGPGQSVVYSHETFFSPVGRAPAQESLRDSVPSPLNINLDPIVVVQSVAITAGVILLIPFPSALFNNTLEENYEEVMAGVNRFRAWFFAMLASIGAFTRRQIEARRQVARPPPAGPPEQPPPPPGAALEQPPSPRPPGAALEQPHVPQPEQRDLWRTPQGMLLFVLLTALLYAFLDPTFGFSLLSLATLAGLALGLFVVVIAYGAPLVAFARADRVGLVIRALPATVAIGILCVILSRLASFQPGYLYGLVIGFLFVGNVGLRTEGRAEAAAAAGSLIAALVAWMLLAAVRGGAAAGDEFGGVLIETALVTIVVAGLEAAVFAMLPLRFMPGAAVYAWDRRVWLVLMAAGLFGFAHVLLNPAAGAGYLADSTRTSFFTLIALLAVFAVSSVLFWAWFRFRPRGAQA
jgi:hypothetical protein